MDKIKPELVEFFFKNGPSQPSSSDFPNNCFPKDDPGRSFHERWYWKKLPSGEITRRKWLSYSKIQNKLYCHYCALFGRQGQINWIKKGISNFQNGELRIIQHELTEKHIMSSMKIAYKKAFFSNTVLNRKCKYTYYAQQRYNQTFN